MRALIYRQLVRSLVMFVLVTLVAGIVYPLVVTGAANLAFSHQAQGSLVYRDGRLVGSALLGQSFTNAKGDSVARYFQARPSATTPTPYDGDASGASNLGPTNPLLIGFIPGVSTYRRDGSVAPRNPFATAADPYCVPTDPAGNPIAVVDPPPTQRYAHTTHVGYVCDPNTIPERAIAYRHFNGLAPNATVPIDAVTASGSGLDPEISLANALDQATRVARARGLRVSSVLALVRRYTVGRQFGFLGEEGVNVLELNLAMDAER